MVDNVVHEMEDPSLDYIGNLGYIDDGQPACTVNLRRRNKNVPTPDVKRQCQRNVLHGFTEMPLAQKPVETRGIRGSPVARSYTLQMPAQAGT